jgi:ABC-2 type transport system permease protein
VLFVICFLVPVSGALLIYLRNNLAALEMLQIPPSALYAIDASFFKYLLRIQGSFAFLIAVFVGPGLVSPDLTHNGLPLYLSRPFSRSDYVIGKLLVLAILQSLVTWVPLLVLYLLQWNLAGNEWLLDNIRVFFAIMIGSWIWISVLSLMAVALSAWVRWKAIAGALMFGVFFVGSGFGAVIKQIFITRWGDLFSLTRSMQVIYSWLFDGRTDETDVVRGVELISVPVWSAVLVLLLVCGICLLLLARRVRAYEVVR